MCKKSKLRTVHVDGYEWKWRVSGFEVSIFTPNKRKVIANHMDVSNQGSKPSDIVDYIDRVILPSHEWYEEKSQLEKLNGKKCSNHGKEVSA